MQAASTKKYVCYVASEPPLNEAAELNQDVREGKLWDFLDAPKILPIVSCVKTDRTGGQAHRFYRTCHCMMSNRSMAWYRVVLVHLRVAICLNKTSRD
jgi:hypothetical protein